MAELTHRVRIERDESGAWIAHVLDIPGCHTYGRTLEQTRKRIREALGLWVGDADSAELTFDVRLPTDVRAQVRDARAARAKASKASEDARRGMASVALALTGKFGLSLRDTADLLGVSHQRVQQLLSDAS